MKKIFMVKVNGWWLGFSGEATDFASAKVYQGSSEALIEKFKKRDKAEGLNNDYEVYVLNIAEKQAMREEKLNLLLEKEN